MSNPKTYQCDSCNEPKKMKAYGRHRESGKLVHNKICIVCSMLKETEESQAENLDRKRERSVRSVEKQITKQRACRNLQQKKERDQKTAIKRELLERELARKSLLAFVKRYQPLYLAGWMHVDICNRLEKFLKAVERGENPRLMLFMPPRHGKSIIASQHFPAWVLGQHPEYEVIAASYGTSLPVKFSRYVRSLLRDTGYQALFPDTRLDPDNENVEGWSTLSGGGFIPAGVGSGIAGKGANILVIDDPVKDAEEADSETIRESTWDWYGAAAYTRLAPNSGVLVIQTRWHDDDLAGRLILQQHDAEKEIEAVGREYIERLDAQRDSYDGMSDGDYAKQLVEIEKDIKERRTEIDHWEVVSYPATAENDEYKTEEGHIVFIDPDSQKPVGPAPDDFDPETARLLRRKGDALHPARYPKARLRLIKRTLQERHWHALYQQNPVPDEGSYFKKEYLRFRDGGPIADLNHMPIGIAWDTAVGKKQQNDYTVGIVGALDFYGNLQIIDCIRARMDTHEAAAVILATYKKYRRMTASVVMVGIERGQLELAMRPELNKLSRELGVYPSYDETLKPLTDKLIRARPLQGRLQAGTVVLPALHSQPWVEIVEHELLRFPSGRFDDCVDALAWLARMAEKNFSIPIRPDVRRAKKAKEKSVQQKLDAILRGQHSGRDPMAA